ncbi:hypothetical protein Sjap_011331 [Stephania japonica]|uniref:Uncharacterized protein n=1 Tax=Stephania japonica TaxID=461633 RepID=A0AAP0JB71_9MAGN
MLLSPYRLIDTKNNVHKVQSHTHFILGPHSNILLGFIIFVELKGLFTRNLGYTTKQKDTITLILNTNTHTFTSSIATATAHHRRRHCRHLPPPPMTISLPDMETPSSPFTATAFGHRRRHHFSLSPATSLFGMDKGAAVGDRPPLLSRPDLAGREWQDGGRKVVYFRRKG